MTRENVDARETRVPVRLRCSGARWLVAVGAGAAVLGGSVWAATLFQAGDVIPAVVLRNGAGSRSDVRAIGTHDGAAWTVTFRRNLDTGDAAADVTFAAGGTYSFQLALFDNAGGTDHDTSQGSNVFTMTVPPTPGALVFSATPGNLTSLTGQLLSNGKELEITAVWPDATLSDVRTRWNHNGTQWSRATENEDRIAVIWDMQNDGFASSGKCENMCHDPFMSTRPGTKIDAWHWKAARSNPVGYADDQYWDDGVGNTVSGRKNDAGQSHESDNAGTTAPSFMAEGDPGVNARHLISGFPQGMREAAPYVAGAWNAGDVLPGFVQIRGAGSRVDTRSTATHDGSSWAVTIRRKLNTGDPDGDILFVPGGTYSFQVAVFDNATGIRHEVSQSANVFTMTIPATPGPLAFSATPGNLTSLAGQLLSSNEVEITATWPDDTKDDVRKKQWTFDGTAWSQAPASDDEDRIAFIWDMQNDGFATTGTCLAMCHPPQMRTSTPGSRVDNWHWKAARSHPGGFTDDQYWDSNNRQNDFGVVGFRDNSPVSGVPSFMTAAGPGNSATYLFDHAPARGWQRAATYVEPVAPPPPPPEPTASTARSAKLSLYFGRTAADSFVLGGAFDKAGVPDLADGLATGVLRIGGYSHPFSLSAKGKSPKDPNISVTLSAAGKSGKFGASLRKVDLLTGLGVLGADGAISREIPWSITLDDGWNITGTLTMTGKVNVRFTPRSDGKRVRLRLRR